MAITRIPTPADLKRLGAFADDLYVRCHHAQYDASPDQDPDWTPTLKRLDSVIAKYYRQFIERGKLLFVAESMVDPWSRCCCGLRFLAQVEPYLDPADVRRLQELWTVTIDLEAELTRSSEMKD